VFDELAAIFERPEPFGCHTARELWTDGHTSARMLSFHLDEAGDLASRNARFIDRSVEWIASRFGLGADSRVADFGCGPGLYATRLARLGAKVTGIDFSPRSVGYAREVAARERLDIRYVTADYLDWETADRFDLVLMIMCDFCALGPAQRNMMLRRFHRILKPGGSVLLDVYALAAFDRRVEGASCGMDLLDGFWAPDRYFGFLNTFKYAREKVVLDKYTIVEPGRIRTVYNWFQCFDPGTLEGELAGAGLALEGLHADVAGTPYDENAEEFAVIARKG
jgi:SAM-dependent methyltransferase